VHCRSYIITETLDNSTEWIHLLISEGECDQLEMLKSFLSVLFTATVKLSYSYTPSTHELLHHLYRISKMNYLFFNLIHFNNHFFSILFFLSHFFSILFFLSHLFLYSFFYILLSISSFSISFSQKVYHEMENIESLDSSLSPIVEAMKEKILKYLEEIPTVIIIANYLHPSFKKKYTIRLLQRYKQNLRLRTNEEENRVNSLLEEMFNIYNSRRNTNDPSTTGHNIRYEF
jgi:Domain of unknown function (DUF4413)